MSLPSKLKRYLLILEKIQRQPSFAVLHDHLAEHGFELSHRTLQRDLERLRIDLGIEVEYDRPNNVYRIAEPNEEHDTVLQLLERAQLLELVGDDPKRVRANSPSTSTSRVLAGCKGYSTYRRCCVLSASARKW